MAPEIPEILNKFPENLYIVPENLYIVPENLYIVPENLNIVPENLYIVPDRGGCGTDKQATAPPNIYIYACILLWRPHTYIHFEHPILDCAGIFIQLRFSVDVQRDSNCASG